MKTPTDEQLDQAFRVSLLAHLFSGLIHNHRPSWVRMGNVESWFLRDRLRDTLIDRPIYVAGLARSGSTILLEVLADHPAVVTHRYRDFPPIFTPYLWHEFLRRAPKTRQSVAERAHGDGLIVGPESPEAMEEAIWMAFFPHVHDPSVCNALDRHTVHPAFERFYCEHIQKLLLSESGQRYVSKGNYNLTRLSFLQKISPDARFVIPIRDPRTHIASLIKQQRLFAAGEARHPRALEHMRRVGHFEFGLDRRAINVGDGKATEVHELWRSGEHVRGWARYWASLYGWLADRLEEDLVLREAAVVVRFEDLCSRPGATLSRIFQHAGLDDAGLVVKHGERIHAPTYYKPDHTQTDEQIIWEETQAVAARFGYVRTNSHPADEVAAVLTD